MLVWSFLILTGPRLKLGEPLEIPGQGEEFVGAGRKARETYRP